MTNDDILYIEDNFHNRRIVRKILERQGYTLHEAEDGLTGFEMLQDMLPKVVLLDISLPGMDGIEIAQRVKANPGLQHIQLIALTASAMAGDRERFLEAGCDDYLSKPFRAMDLVELVNSYMSADGSTMVRVEPEPVVTLPVPQPQNVAEPGSSIDDVKHIEPEPLPVSKSTQDEQKPIEPELKTTSPAVKPPPEKPSSKQIDDLISAGISGLINPDTINPPDPNRDDE